ncbi:MAG: hypothetical protein WCP11_00715 [Candidatus Saccharibacteria bacterium]
MPPNIEQPPSLDYLNQIAPQQAPKGLLGVLMSNKKMMILVIAAIVVVLFFIVAAVGSSSGNTGKPSEKLAARLLATQQIVTDGTAKLKSSKLRTYNANLTIYLTNTIRDIEPLLKNENTDIKKLDKKVTNAESSADTLSKLENARLNVVYDRTYAREIAYKLNTVLAMMSQTYKNSNNKTLKTFLEDAIKNLKPTQSQFADFDAAQS